MTIPPKAISRRNGIPIKRTKALSFFTELGKIILKAIWIKTVD